MTPTDPLHDQSAGPSLRTVITSLVGVDELSPAEGDVLRERRMNARHEDVPIADIPRYTWLLSR